MKWWPFESFRRISDKNGAITVERIFNHWRVIVNGYNETSDGMNKIWRDALQYAKKHLPQNIKHVLILGLGGGGMLKDTYEFFPNTTITAVEHDSEMIVLTKELKMYAPFPLPEILEGDAGDILPTLATKYDLIVIDLFDGGTPSPLLLKDSFIKTVKEKLSKSGVLLVNVAGKEQYLNSFGAHFAQSDTWKFRLNHIGMYRDLL